MTLKTSFNSKDAEIRKINPEKAWFVESLMRFKLIPIILTIMYFLTNILPVLIFYNEFEGIASYVESTMRMMNAWNMFIAIGGGVLAASAVFGYLHKTASVTDAHSRPLTRKSLFRASFTSGLMMIVLPIIITGFLYMCVQGAQVSPDISPDLVPISTVDGYMLEETIIITVQNSFGWMAGNLLVAVYSYCVSCFAGILAGTGVIQTLLSFFLLSLPTMIYLISQGLAISYLRGYEYNFDMTEYLSLYAYYFSRGKYPLSEFSVTPIVYVVIMMALVFISLILYKRINLENEENSIAVPYVSSVLVVILTFISVSTSLLISDTVFSSSSSIFTSLIVIILTTAVSFPVFCMIADQTFRVFNKHNLKILGIYAILMCITLMFTMFDIIGYEKSIPNVGDIKTADIQGSVGFHSGDGERGGINKIDNAEAIGKIIILHNAVVNTDNPDDGSYTAFFKVVYHLKNGKTITRAYDDVPRSTFTEYANLYDDSYIRTREQINPALLKKKGVRFELERYNEKTGSSIIYKVPENLIPGLIEAANKDIMNWTAKNRYVFIDEKYDADSIGVSIRITDINRDVGYEEGTIDVGKSFSTKDKYVTEFLDSHPEIFTKANIIEEYYY